MTNNGEGERVNKTTQDKKLIQDFITTYLIPEYEGTYTDEILRGEFIILVDEAVKAWEEGRG